MELKFHSSKDFANLILPEEISKRISPLGYAFADFSRKRKVSAGVGGMSPQKRLVLIKPGLGRQAPVKPPVWATYPQQERNDIV